VPRVAAEGTVIDRDPIATEEVGVPFVSVALLKSSLVATLFTVNALPDTEEDRVCI
jgi:hypothetical protein